MKGIKTTSGAAFVPQEVYYYKALKDILETLRNRPGFEDDCENWWRCCDSEKNEVIADAYDGNAWKKFQLNGDLSFSKVRNYRLMLNVNWFQPFKDLSSFSDT